MELPSYLPKEQQKYDLPKEDGMSFREKIEAGIMGLSFLAFMKGTEVLMNHNLDSESKKLALGVQTLGALGILYSGRGPSDQYK